MSILRQNALDHSDKALDTFVESIFPGKNQKKFDQSTQTEEIQPDVRQRLSE